MVTTCPNEPDSSPVADEPEANEQLACCWTQDKPTTFDLAVGSILVLAGVGLMVLGWSFFARPIKPAPGEAMFFGALGLLMVAGGLLAMFHKMFASQHALAITADGIELVTQTSSRKLQWSEIHKILTLEFFPHRFADMRLVVTIEPVTGRAIKFDTDYQGDPGAVLHYLTTNCDYIVRNPQGYTKRTD
jgi:hypothetical protein